MLDDVSSIWKMINTLWYVGAGAFGLCVTGFFYIMKSKDKFEDKIEGKVNEAVIILLQIKDALVGTLDKKGIKTIVYELEEEVRNLKVKI